MKLVGAKPSPKVTGLDELPGKSNYFIGNDPKQWRTGVPTYAQVKYQGIYSGIDLVYYGNQQRLEYDFVLAPKADPRAIAWDAGGENGYVAGLGSNNVAIINAKGEPIPFHPDGTPLTDAEWQQAFAERQRFLNGGG